MIFLAMPGGRVTVPAGRSRELRMRLPADQQFFGPLAAPAEGNIIDVLALGIPGAPWPAEMKHCRRPTIAVVGDDPGNAEGQGGPDAWQCTAKLSRWARSVIVHGAGGEPEHYAAAVQAALKVGRVALIETTSMHARAWAECIGCPRTLLILPKGGRHPIQAAEAAP